MILNSNQENCFDSMYNFVYDAIEVPFYIFYQEYLDILIFIVPLG